MRDVITNILGEYTVATGANGEPISGVAALDYTWIAGAVIFCICLVGVISLLRIAFKKVRGM